MPRKFNWKRASDIEYQAIVKHSQCKYILNVNSMPELGFWRIVVKKETRERSEMCFDISENNALRRAEQLYYEMIK